MTSVFLDSSFLKAVVDGKDDFSEEALLIWKTLTEQNIPLVISNYILDESLTLIRVRNGLDHALRLRDLLFRSDCNLTMYRVTATDEDVAWEWFEKDWSKLSFTDCVCFAQMKRLGIKDVATFDRHYEKAGFRMVGEK